MNCLMRKTGAFEHDSYLPVGAVPSNAIKSDYELTIPDVCDMFKVQRSSVNRWITTGMIRFRMDGDTVYFLEPEIRHDIQLAKMHDAFKTMEERNAFLIGAQRFPRMFSPSMHYTFQARRNSEWLNGIETIGKTK